jgi:hypothetical protein
MPSAFIERTDICIEGDNGPGNWEKGYDDEQNCLLRVNGHGYDESTQLNPDCS